MKPQNKKLKKPKIGYQSTYKVNNYNKDDIDAFFEVASEIGFTRKHTIKVMHSIGMYVTK